MITVWGFIYVMAIATVLVTSMAMPAKGMQMNRFDRYKQNIGQFNIIIIRNISKYAYIILYIHITYIIIIIYYVFQNDQPSSSQYNHRCE